MFDSDLERVDVWLFSGESPSLILAEFLLDQQAAVKELLGES